MSSTTITSREFNQDVSRAKRASAGGPVFITDRGQTKHVLLTVEDYQKLAGQDLSLLDALAMPVTANSRNDFDWTPPRITNPMHKDADLS